MLTVNLLQLQAFVVAAETGSFSAAARKMKKTHSAISMTISNLELDVNQELFDRSTRNPTLTQAGEVLLKEAKLILAQCEHFERLASELEPEEETEFTLALDSVYSVPFEKEILTLLADQFPRLKLKLIEKPSSEVIAAVIKEEAQIGFTLLEQPIFSNLGAISLPPAELLYIASPEHPLAALETVALVDLQRYRQAYLSHQTHVSDNATSPNTWECESISAAKTAIGYGLCWGMAVEPFIRPQIESGQIVRLKVESSLRKEIPAALIWKVGKESGKVHNAIRALYSQTSSAKN
ncbi:LysR family transcriptional regulator [Vibrio hangzhouensis]|uniref:LysR family transcriptional regulator n=1 Tax=Vibrio hangzhouensis TaxID=462991 RepID=UPI001C96F93A|nr:LysR family transcriptional regulator [Vibrio hangzhouensis]MBY6195986.1 LysR family transcriptional regulator [Vibrio hangzhouensis]